MSPSNATSKRTPRPTGTPAPVALAASSPPAAKRTSSTLNAIVTQNRGGRDAYNDGDPRHRTHRKEASHVYTPLAAMVETLTSSNHRQGGCAKGRPTAAMPALAGSAGGPHRARRP